MLTAISLLRHLVTPAARRQRPGWWAYLGSFGDDILFEDEADD